MTKDEVKRRAELYSALAEGKTIQAQNPSGGEWFDAKIETLRSICEEINYRIKPESKYRPFKTRKECWEEMHKHPDFGWVKDKEKLSYYPIQEVSDTNHYRNLLNDYEFTDGAPFGVKEE